MGWLFKFSCPRRSDMIADLSKGWESKRPDGVTVKTACIAKCYKGNPGSGAMWAVYEQTFSDNTPPKRILACNLLRYCNRDKCWGYKDMDESMGPCEVNCPLSYLDMVPCPQGEYAAPWRERVKEYNKKLVVGRRYNLKNCKIPYVTITKLRPLMGEYNGINYRVSRRLIGAERTGELVQTSLDEE